MIRKVIALANVILTAAVLVLTVIITHTYFVRPHQVKGLSDWFLVLLPLVPPLVALFSSFSLWRIQKRTPVGKGIVWGMFVSCVAYMVLQAWTLSTQFTQISKDGTEHWARLEMPAFWLVPPLLLIAMGIGGLAGWIVKSKLRNQTFGEN